jgi:hypothetical protein
MKDGSDAVSDWPLLNALLNTASGATWVSLHHGGGVGMGYSQHSGVVIVCDGTTRPPQAHRTRAVERPGHRRDAPCRRGLRHRRGLRQRAGPEPADARMTLHTEVPIGQLTLAPGQLRWKNCRPSTPAARLVIDPAALPASRPAPRGASGRRGDAPVYGVNTGFGKLASTRISSEDLATLQLNLIRSHSVGVGEPLARRGAADAGLKAASLARGYSGVRRRW